ncbi:hypothetical protein BC936DRAFT_147156 [Jimgerdemannia flammicorona]|uniref:Uncharacterized protein n=1 Tax=Jimgerdemannia flammicorona TaxID=994334 RepID=A0A433D609_9FUNG|nr:hypothetical protein BC936DRAFT_147156 [Jimgerdemannia flammicorona]
MGKLNVLGLDDDTLGMDRSKVSVFKQGDEISFRGLLQGTNSRALEAQVSLEVLGNFTNKALEG